jgi:TolB-like protein
MQIFRELQKRRVIASALIYVPFAWITTEVLTFLFEKFSAAPWADALVAAAFVAGFPAFIVLAWTFDVGPQGITRTSASRLQGYLATGLSALIMVAGTLALFQRIETAPAEVSATTVSVPAKGKPARNSIAVYTFENLSSDPENAYFSEGMTSELVTRLSQVQGLQVAASTLSRQEVASLGLEPAVSYRLEGSVRKAGTAVRIAVLLTDASTGFTVWSQDYDGDLDDVFALQEQTALTIIRALDLELGQSKSDLLIVQELPDREAYDAYLRGWSLLESLHLSFDGFEEKLSQARGHFQQALAIEPAYTRAIAGLSMVESSAVMFELEPEEHLVLARTLAEEALAGDDSLYESHFAMARVMSGRGRVSQALSEFRKVVELDAQNGYAWCEMSAALNQQDPIGAEFAAREAIRFRPAYSRGYMTLGAALAKQARLSEAIDAYEQSLLLDPGNQALREVVGELNGQLNGQLNEELQSQP